jgi:hypothetical protein
VQLRRLPVRIESATGTLVSLTIAEFWLLLADRKLSHRALVAILFTLIENGGSTVRPCSACVHEVGTTRALVPGISHSPLRVLCMLTAVQGDSAALAATCYLTLIQVPGACEDGRCVHVRVVCACGLCVRVVCVCVWCVCVCVCV